MLDVLSDLQNHRGGGGRGVGAEGGKITGSGRRRALPCNHCEKACGHGPGDGPCQTWAWRSLISDAMGRALSEVDASTTEEEAQVDLVSSEEDPGQIDSGLPGDTVDQRRAEDRVANKGGGARR